jgi:ubiquinone/menaquinone biosynthesis C-methylase UbiE
MSSKSGHIVLPPPAPNEFERLYIDLRRHEKRIYSDEEVVWLPEIDKIHVHRKEWKVRQRSCRRLIRYLRRKHRPLTILEVGCGNGWLSYQLSQIPHSRVVGLDINLQELQQAERVFVAVPNLRFVYGELNSSILQSQKFDVVVFAACIQYFESLPDVVLNVFDRLNEKGEIHIIDSHFYKQEELQQAKQRSLQYFNSQGYDRMQDFYFHHSLEELSGFRYQIFFDPSLRLNRVLNSGRPFHWICIRK